MSPTSLATETTAENRERERRGKRGLRGERVSVISATRAAAALGITLSKDKLVSGLLRPVIGLFCERLPSTFNKETIA